MNATPTHGPLRQLAHIAALSLLAVLAACGGSGGASTSNGSNNGQNGGSTQTSTTVGPVTLSGVAAVGAPMLGATISVVDALGTTQGTTTSNTADGSYQMALSSTNIPLPLLIEATGIDMTGAPVTLHSLVQTASSSDATKLTAHITPITEAIVAMLLGTDPLPQFRQASTKASTWTLLSDTSALSSAASMIKTIINRSIVDAKVTDPVNLDFFKDATFSANKSGMDGVLEGLQIQIGTDHAGREQIELSNRLLGPAAPEVTINLSSVKTELALGTTGKPVNAITSTLKATTSVAAMINYVSSLDTMVSTINSAIAQQSPDITIAALPIFSTSYVTNNGFDKFNLAAQFAQFGSNQWQLSRFQFTGCADDPVPTKGCTRPSVSALLSDSTGQVVDIFSNVVTYVTATGWGFRGNDSPSPWSILPSAWASWTAAGQFSTSGQGVLLQVQPVSNTLLANVSLPSAHSVPLYDCGLTYWCFSSVTSGDLVADHMLQASTLGWFGQQDAAKGARYQLSTQSLIPQKTVSQVLPNDVPQDTPSSRFPMIDGLSSTTQLSCANVIAGPHVTWDAWATANPQLRMISVHSMVTNGITTPSIQKATVYPLSGNSTNVPAVSSPPSTPTACQLWMIAQDKLGRRFISKVVATPP